MIGLRLFLPESWTSDAARMAKAAVPDACRKARTKPEIALAEIAGYSKDTFPNAKDLNKYLKGQSGKVQARICQAFNDRRKELGL